MFNELIVMVFCIIVMFLTLLDLEEGGKFGLKNT